MEKLRAMLPGWETVRCIGSGSTGRVYELKKKDEYGGDYSSALKVITIPSTQKEYDEMEKTMSEFAMRAKLRDKVEEISSEYRLMGVLRGHPNIVNCEDQMIVPHEDDLGWDIYIRMELLSSLPAHVGENGMPVSEVIKLGIDICSALELCRANGIIHRDIKPQNIFVSKYGGYKLGDFSIAKSSNLKGQSDVAGTYSYMAPEVYKGRAYDDRVDIYSLGMVLYCLLNEQRGPFLPLDGVPTQAETGEAQMRRFRGDELPPPKLGNAELKKVILKACAFEVSERYADPTEMKRALLSALKTSTEPVRVMPDADETVRESIRIPEPADRTPKPLPDMAAIKKEKTKPPVKPVADEKSKDPKSGGSMTAVIALAVIAVLLAAGLVCFIVFGGSNEGTYEPGSSQSPEKTDKPTERVKVSALVISSPKLVITEGDSAVLTVSCIPELPRGSQQPQLVWKSSNSEIATVDEMGNVAGISEGSTTVFVYLSDDKDIFDKCEVVVEAPVAERLEIDQLPTKTVYAYGEKLDTTGLILHVYYNNGADKVVTDPAEYSVECSLDSFGSRAATVSCEGVTAEYTVRVSLFG